MDGLRQRGVMALTGALCGAGLYVLTDVLANDLLPERLALFLAVFAAVFSSALLVLIGPMRLSRAALAALAVALVVAVLTVIGSFRHEAADSFLSSVHPVLAAVALAFLPLPFIIARAVGPDWRHYPTLFSQSWSLVVRATAAWVFTGVAWGVIVLSNLLFGLVGLTIIDKLLEIGIVPWLITFGVLGLSLAVVMEMADVLSPALVLRLMRLLLIPVLVVLVVFLIALPLSGMDGFGGMSAAATLLVMTAAGATLVTTAIDQTEAQAVHGRTMHWAARAMAVLLPLPALLAAWAVWLRVDEYGWSPERLCAAALALIGLGYGVTYAVAVVRGSHWMARIRQANVGMALAIMAISAIWLGVFPAEWISARDQLARYYDGRTSLGALDTYALNSWGKAGAAAMAELQELSKQPGQEQLAAKLSGEIPAEPPKQNPELLADLKALMPLQPASASATRDILLTGLDDGYLQTWHDACAAKWDGARAGCVMAIADFLPRVPGEEALILTRSADGWVDINALGLGDDGSPRFLSVSSLTGQLPQLQEGEDFLKRIQDGPLSITPAPINRIDLGGPETGIILLP